MVQIGDKPGSKPTNYVLGFAGSGTVLTRITVGLVQNTSQSIVAGLLASLRSTTYDTAVDKLRPTFYGQLGMRVDGGRSLFRKRLSLEDILENVLLGKSLKQVQSHSPLTAYERAVDALAPVNVSLRA
jgi:hypothetical protein